MTLEICAPWLLRAEWRAEQSTRRNPCRATPCGGHRLHRVRRARPSHRHAAPPPYRCQKRSKPRLSKTGGVLRERIPWALSACTARPSSRRIDSAPGGAGRQIVRLRTGCRLRLANATRGRVLCEAVTSEALMGGRTGDGESSAAPCVGTQAARALLSAPIVPRRSSAQAGGPPGRAWLAARAAASGGTSG